MATQLTTKDFFNQPSIKGRFQELLGERGTQFITSVLQVASNNSLLSKASPESIYGAAITAAVLDLPIQNNLGFAYIVPYKGQAQFQIGWKGFVQLAWNTGIYKNINVIEVYEEQFISFNPLTEVFEANFDNDESDTIVGYCAYFKMLNGAEKTVYWTRKKVERHAKKYSQAYKSGGMSPWSDPDQFHEMAKKTVLKNMLSKWGKLSVEMQRAITFDQAVSVDGETVKYVDNVEVPEHSEKAAEMLKNVFEETKNEAPKTIFEDETTKGFNRESEGSV